MTADARSSRAPGALFIVNSLRTGGAEKQVITLLNHLDTRRFRLHLAYLKRGGESLMAQLCTERLDEVLCCDVRRRIDAGAVRRLRSLIATKRIDALVCTNPYSMLYGHLARGARGGTRLASVFHSTQLLSFKERLQMRIYRPLFNRSDLLVYVCDNQRRYWREQGLRAPDEVIHNGIDPGFFRDRYSAQDKHAIRGALGWDPRDYVVGLCSALRPEKAPVDLLRAAARLREWGLPAKVLFIGDGPERARVEQAARTLGLSAHVRISGLQQDVRPFTACCDVMTLVSHSETFSMAALEAMALGKPMVMSDTGGASELIVHGEQGLLFAPADIETLARHLQTLTSATLRARLGEAAAHRVRERFTVEAMTGRFTDSLERLLAGRDAHRSTLGHEHARPHSPA